MKRMCNALIIAAAMLLLILDTKTAVSGATDGIHLCLRVLIPSLFPFFLISILLTDALVGISSPLLRPLGKLLKIPAGSESIFLVGMLGGYPVGAQIIAQSVQKGMLVKQDAVRMMGFCNNVGPAFLFGVISTQFPNTSFTWLIWIIIILSTIFTAMILPGSGSHPVTSCRSKPISLTQAMEKSIKVMAGICGWVVIFRVIMAFLERWLLWMLPATYAIVLQMLLELANGCTAINLIDNITVRFIVCVTGLCIGSLCVLLQTKSAANILGIGKYIPGKLIQAVISFLLAIPTVYMVRRGIAPLIIASILLSCLPILIFMSLYRVKRKNKYGNLLTAGV